MLVRIANREDPYQTVFSGSALFVLAFVTYTRPLDKSVYWKTIFFISQPKHMLWVLKRTVSMRRFF